ncbi:MAG: protease complex subunit PrcB family protein, partial [Planctomycetota bacterium]|nr:protease complex subunit PrcB family protein [Planctomycetota bacterium]
DTEMLLVVTLGRRTSDRYEVRVSRVWRDRGVLRVEVSVQQPAPGGPIAVSSPYCVAVIPKCIFNVADFDHDPPDRTRTWQQSAPPTGQW